MPDRIIRADILTSEPVNQLTWSAEVFYRRIMSVADDYGRLEGNLSLLRASLYPLKLDKVTNSDVAKWIHECVEAGLLRIYMAGGKQYMEIPKFGQRLRAMRSKYPEPEQYADTRQQPPSSADSRTRNETNPKQNPKRNGSAGEPAESGLVFPFESEEFKDLWQKWKNYKLLDHKFSYKSRESEQAALQDLAKVSGGVEQTAREIILQSMAKGWKGFFELKQSVNGTSKPDLGSLKAAHARRFGNGEQN